MPVFFCSKKTFVTSFHLISFTAHCTGPRKVAYCELYDHGDATFTLNVKPQEPGKHLLTIKYGGQHVTGSPFALKVAGAPDASKVRSYVRLI